MIKTHKRKGNNNMALYRAFKAFRPEKSKQALIPALPYDVMNSEEAREAVKGNPY